MRGTDRRRRLAPRRQQPGLSWLLFGASIGTALWWLASLLLAAYVRFSGSFGQTYGQLTGMMALLLWANLTGVALFGGLSFGAQLEALRVGVRDPAQPDRWKPLVAAEPGAAAAEPGVPEPMIG